MTGTTPTLSADGTVTPIPDPTKLTTDAVNAATTQWRRDLDGMRLVLETRLDAMDLATRLRLDAIADTRADTTRQIDHLEHLHSARFASVDTALTGLREFLQMEIRAAAAVAAERFEAVNTRFLERDKATEQAAQEARISLQAALAAAKEAVALQNEANSAANIKTESNFTKQIDAFVAAFAAANKALDDKIADIRQRLDRGEGSHTGAAESRVERRLDIGQAASLTAVALTVIGLIITIILIFHK